MEDSVQFRLNVRIKTPKTHKLTGKNVWFQLRPVDGETKRIRDEKFVEFEERIKIEWNWIDERCIICFSLIKSDTQESVWKCPHCEKLAHYDHVVSWIREKHKCPVCRQPVEI
ncbi:MAG: hypothetical protein ACE5I5_05030 [Candidatus Heimdallarchaeota archaeon]